ncbi:TPA: hypothetical protein ACH3X2_012205 [Trebouxia sp. C0005]
MHWLSETCVLLRCSDLIDSNYTSYRSAAGQFSVPRPYQASGLLPEAGTDVEPPVTPEEIPFGSSPDQGAAEEAKQPQTRAILLEEVAKQHSVPAHKRRKTTVPDPQAQGRQLQAQQRHNVWQPSLLAACRLLQQHLQAADGKQSLLQPDSVSGTAQTSSNERQQDISTGEDDSLDLVSLCELKHALRPKFAFLAGSVAESTGAAFNLFDTVIWNEDSTERLGHAFGSAVLIPAQAPFLLSDIKRLKPLLPGTGQSGFHCIVLDPPWENKSAKRGSKYPTLPSRDLKAIPLQKLMHQEGCLVAMWVTNRERHHRFIHEELLPHWGLLHVATWFWLKVTNAGELVSPLEVAHRRPYEVLILLKPIHHPSSKQLPPSHVVQHQTLHKDSVSTSMSDEGGRDIAAFADPPASKYQASEAKLSSSSGASDCNLQGPDVRFQGHQSAARERARASSKLPNGLVMVTVPGQHSRKPQLAHLLRPCLPAKPKCLEMFARELTSGWTSWGNQVLQFQHMHHFQPA